MHSHFTNSQPQRNHRNSQFSSQKSFQKLKFGMRVSETALWLKRSDSGLYNNNIMIGERVRLTWNGQEPLLVNVRK